MSLVFGSCSKPSYLCISRWIVWVDWAAIVNLRVRPQVLTRLPNQSPDLSRYIKWKGPVQPPETRDIRCSFNKVSSGQSVALCLWSYTITGDANCFVFFSSLFSACTGSFEEESYTKAIKRVDSTEFHKSWEPRRREKVPFDYLDRRTKRIEYEMEVLGLQLTRLENLKFPVWGDRFCTWKMRQSSILRQKAITIA